MKLASFRVAGRTSWGVVEGDSVIDTGAVMNEAFADLTDLITKEGVSKISSVLSNASRYKLSGITFLPVIPAPSKILCVGLNYEMHRKETGRTEVDHPTIFARFANSQIGHLSDIIRPKISHELDYEGELAIVISRPGRYIKAEDAMSYVAGFSCYNDVSVRDFQRHTHQFTPGKNFPATGAFGPWLVTPDEMGAIGPQRLQTRLNGVVVQDALLSQMIFNIPKQIEYCSSFTQLEPGDVIVTGTPGGVGAKRQPPLWMKPGDLVEVEIDQVGILRNHIVAEVA